MNASLLLRALSLTAVLLASACVPPPSASVSAPDPTPVASAADGVPVNGPGLVSAADTRAAQAGVQMLRLGGSATDAAIATMLALTVVEPQSSGIGGGGFLVLGDAAGRVETIDGRETAPKAATPDWFYVDGKPLVWPNSVIGGRSVGVPGNLRLAAMAHNERGKLAWRTLFQPAIRLARDGFEITPRMRTILGAAKRTGAFDPAARALFYDAAGEPLPVGTVVRNPALADTLESIASRGADSFYTGDNAMLLASKVGTAPQNPSPLTTADLAAYKAVKRPAVCGQYRQYRVCGMGPPSSGATTVYAILKQLERFDMKALGPTNPVAWHLIAESQRLAYADREQHLADSDFVPVPVAGLIDPAYLAARSALISDSATMPTALPGTPAGAKLAFARPAYQEEHGTTHFVSVDRWGNAATYTSTIEGPFGSGLMVGGYYLNNELTDFNIVPDKDGKPTANRVEGGKRPRSSMSPTLIYGPDGSLRLAVGAAGGTTIPAQVAKAIIGVLDWNLSAREAIALPVIFAPGNAVSVEKDTSLEAMIPALQALGHAQVTARPPGFKANAIERVRVGGKWVWRGAADPRSEGAAVAP
ncbi:MAG: gamma-glutamyltransferase [Novosphingobium sp. 28-62-57]|uniref:gamma-glutamyltransferase n=1 Tax=unclassified Novosphingobium TaxID=2644732 RepID=UPI000BC70EA2|nr:MULTISPECIES: gamma-glutamyltransferase [unclassified Novosphingobium]OYW50310.1 MAG: gamma-glutamyltransferase [Novosphingobium sp. 12-62-10]OYZ11586.1 MAG: gamma-glutamyltransferase [Novosphingobium sp. 28-62-57]OZA31399.1 MAG: gamma-glutamyltransferase [Novosphingobium sp. 17-62-9]HQS71340.1 gamma-glutamyltransferase [Novosphingobium sp.]